jgi:hypothetical protein
MIQTIDEQINKFLASLPDINDDQSFSNKR